MVEYETPPQMSFLHWLTGEMTTTPAIALELQAEDPWPGWGVGSFRRGSSSTARILIAGGPGAGFRLAAQRHACAHPGLVSGSRARHPHAASLGRRTRVDVSAPLRLGVNYVASPDFVEQD